MHQKPILEVKHLKKSYHNTPILNDVSFSIFPGEIIGLLGHNGAGKTTAFYITLGFVKPDSGSIFFNGTDVTKLPTHIRARMGMGYLAQEPSIFRSMTVRNNLLCIAETLSLSRKEEQEIVDALIQELNLTAIAHKKATLLSGGEKRRVEIARALVRKPSLLLLDEPFANIDPKTISDVKEMIRMLSEKGISILITDHNAREIFSLAFRSYLISDGRILTSGTSEELMAHEEARRSYFGREFAL